MTNTPNQDVARTRDAELVHESPRLATGTSDVSLPVKPATESALDAEINECGPRGEGDEDRRRGRGGRPGKQMRERGREERSRGRGRDESGRHPRRRGRRGDARSALLLLIDEQPRHGYELMTAIAERTNGRWRPSPGSIYPTLKHLVGEGLVEVNEDQSDRGIASLTIQGREYVAAHHDDLAKVWDGAGPGNGRGVAQARHDLSTAAKQVERVGNEEQVSAAISLLNEATQALYLVLANQFAVDSQRRAETHTQPVPVSATAVADVVDPELTPE